MSGKKASTKKAASPAASQDSVRRSHGEETSEEVPGQTAAQASKYSAMTSYRPEELQGIDEQLPSLPDNYGENRIVLLPRDPSWLFAYWNLTEEYKEAARAAGGKNLAIRLYDVSGIDFDSYGTQVTYEHECTEWARSWYLPMPLAGREYIVEIGYRGGVDWYPLARSTRVFAPQEQPASAGSEFTTIPFDEELRHARHRLPRTEGPQSPLAAGSPQTLFDDGAFRIVMNATPGTPSGAPNVPLFSKVMLGAGEGFPGSLGQMPGSLGQMPGSLGQLPGSLGQMPGSLGQMPGSLGQMPGSLEQPGHLPGSVGLAGMDATFAMTQVSPGAGGQLVQGQVSAPVVLEEANQPMLQASIEIVISGRSFPNTDLTIADQVIPVGPDGGFSLRVSIPEGLREIPITAKSRSTSEVRSIKLWFGSQCE